MTNQKLLGEYLRHHRKRAGLNQQQLAERAGICASTLSSFELGEVSPKVTVLERLCLELSRVEGAPVVRIYELLREVEVGTGTYRAVEMRQEAQRIRHEVAIKSEWVENGGPPDNWREGSLALDLAYAKELEDRADRFDERDFSPRPKRPNLKVYA